MASNTTKKQTEAKAEGDKPKRKNLTPAERIAKAEAELAEIRRKAEEAANKKANVLREQRSKLVTKVAELEGKIAEINGELNQLGVVEGDVATEATPAEAQPEG